MEYEEAVSSDSLETTYTTEKFEKYKQTIYQIVITDDIMEKKWQHGQMTKLATFINGTRKRARRGDKELGENGRELESNGFNEARCCGKCETRTGKALFRAGSK